MRDDPARPPEVCVCICHASLAVHVKPCCVTCPECRLPIVAERIKEHSVTCGEYHGPPSHNEG